MSQKGEIILYQDSEGATQIEVHMENETVWLSQAQMAKLFQANRSVITKHVSNIYKDGELEKEATCAKIAQLQVEGNRKVQRTIEYYNLDMIISIGYRVNSKRGIHFRMWATKTLREYLIKGFVMDDERLAGNRSGYFDELLERVRTIRTSEANLYDKVKAIFSTSIDYESSSELARTFYSTVQNKFHFAITGKTAAELIVERVDSQKPQMGLTHRKREIVTRQEAEVAKNYMEELELKRLALLVEQFLSLAELQSIERRAMYMRDWVRKLDAVILVNDKLLLTHSGKVSHKRMQSKVKTELEKYNQQQPLPPATLPLFPQETDNSQASDTDKKA